jgi:ribosomal protein S18 acetylase RimI-like enzyme
MDARTLARLEGIALRAWPAVVVRAHKGMLLRATGGESRRSNSAALHACAADLGVDEAIAVAEELYASRGMPCQLQIGPLAPPGIDDALAARGYAVAAPVHVQTAPIDELIAVGPRASARAEITDAPGPAWIDVEIARGRFAPIADTFLALLGALPCAGFGVAYVDGAPAAACLATLEEDVVVVSAMRTLPELRRSGAARALLRAAGEWARARGAALAYLQVETDNAAAQRLYAGAGFATIYGYHYRVRPR